MTRHQLPLLPLATLLLSFSVTAASTPDLEVSGFGRLVGGYLDDSKASYEGYGKDSVSFSQDSLLGIQGDLFFNDQLSTTVQALAHSGDDRDSGLEWAYITYQPLNGLQFKIGRMRTPLYTLSNVIDVGFTYPYITPPQQIYTGYTIDRFDGFHLPYLWYKYPIPINLREFWYSERPDILNFMEKNYAQFGINFRPLLSGSEALPMIDSTNFVEPFTNTSKEFFGLF